MEELILKEAEYKKLIRFIESGIKELDYNSVMDRQKREAALEILNKLSSAQNVQYEETFNVYAIMLPIESIKQIITCAIGFM